MKTTYGDGAVALKAVAASRGVPLTDGPALLALATALFVGMPAFDVECIAMLALDCASGTFVAVPCAVVGRMQEVSS